MANRTKWSDSMIEDQLRAISDSLGHFPSVSELRQLKHGPLESVVGKRGGIMKWSEKLGIKRLHSDSDTGWSGEIEIKSILESHGFEKVERSNGVKCPYDLLINDRIRCDVKTTNKATHKLNTGQDWSAWFYCIGKSVQSDIVILYRKDVKDCFILPWWEVGTTNITISPNSPKYNKFKDRYDIITSFDDSIRSLREKINK